MTYESLTDRQWDNYQRLCGYLCDGYVPYEMSQRRDALLKAWGDNPDALFITRFKPLMDIDVARNYVLEV